MAGKAIGKSMNLGYAGSYSRTPDDIVVSRILDGGDIEFGQAVALASDNTFTPVDEDTVAGDIAGIALRVVKQATNYASQNTVKYLEGELINVLERGCATVVCNVGTPTAGGKVYVRIKKNAAVTGGVIGGFEATADVAVAEGGVGGNDVTTYYNIEVPNMRWSNGYIDSNKVTEVTILTRVNP